jgi:2'-5' RNA ligase
MRLFIAVEAPENEKIERFQHSLERTGARLRFVSPKNLHLTIKFIGETSINPDRIWECMNEACLGLKSFESSLQGCGVFPNPSRPRVVWIGMTGVEQLREIAIGIEKKLEKLGIQKEDRGFKAHLTIARIKSPEKKEELLAELKKWNSTHFANFKINSVSLYKSELQREGPKYTKLAQTELK